MEFLARYISISVFATCNSSANYKPERNVGSSGKTMLAKGDVGTVCGIDAVLGLGLPSHLPV